MTSQYRNVPVRPATYRRLAAFKTDGQTFDEALNVLMDAYPEEIVSDRLIREMRRRLKNFKGIPLEEVRRRLDGKK